MVGAAHEVSLYANEESRAIADGPESVTERDYNLGGVLGIGLKASAGPFTAAMSWDSHIFLTGSPFIVFLASGRRQAVSLTVGLEL